MSKKAISVSRRDGTRLLLAPEAITHWDRTDDPRVLLLTTARGGKIEVLSSHEDFTACYAACDPGPTPAERLDAFIKFVQQHRGFGYPIAAILRFIGSEPDAVIAALEREDVSSVLEWLAGTVRTQGYHR